MKAAPFAYVRPGRLDDVLGELAGGDGKVLAGGQSLVPVLAMRLGRPGTLVDITAVPELTAAGPEQDGYRIGAAVRQRTVEHDRAAHAVPLIGMAMPFVGHRELRSRGTVCGSLAHADPAAELPAVACCAQATVELAGPAGRRSMPAEEFVTGAMTTAAGPEDVVVAVTFPHARPGEGFGFAEIARRHGDFALAGVVTRVRVGDDGAVTEARLTGFGISDRAVTRDVTPLLTEHEDDLRPATAALADEVVDTGGDTHGSTGYRRRLFGVLAARELSRALHRARDRKEHS
ncbi:molybdopterin dehydrogenase [Pseudonocardia sp. UM4_GMWB1]|uniref:FAD binding domain-containing protein n=1 Tax=Pseudonocardia sp. UM4_GMWB1 TaxID=2212989 RepID=UPI00091456ED|nr:6-hydroxypseudooxynicotine dehydrogenase complex subunit alpha [Pseudonocardia autotrophica]